MKIWNIFIIFFLYITMFTLSVNSRKTDEMVAIVNNNIILESEINDPINKIQYNISDPDQILKKNCPLYQEILNQIIINNLIMQTVIQKKININYDQCDQLIHDITCLHHMTLEQFKKYLHQINISYEKYYSKLYQEIVKNIVYQKIVDQNINMHLNEINKFYSQLNSIDLKKQFKFVHIIFSTPIQPIQTQMQKIENMIKELKTKIKLNKNIDDIIDTNFTKDNLFQKISKHETQWTTWQDVPVIFDKYFKKTIKIKEIIGPIYSYDGIHILMIKDMQNNKSILPTTKVKIKTIILKKKDIDHIAIQKLLNIKKQIENKNTTFNILMQNKLQEDIFIKDDQEHLLWKNINCFDEKIKKTILSLKNNEISMPIYTKHGWTLIQLIDLYHLNDTEIIQERAYLHLLNEKFNTIIQDWIKDLKSTSYIQYIYP